jgi:hypothetical protein
MEEAGQQLTDGHKAALLIAPDDGIRHHRKAKTFLRHQLVSFSPVPRREGNAYKPSMVEILPSVVEEVSASRTLRGLSTSNSSRIRGRHTNGPAQ